MGDIKYFFCEIFLYISIITFVYSLEFKKDILIRVRVDLVNLNRGICM